MNGAELRASAAVDRAGQCHATVVPGAQTTHSYTMRTSAVRYKFGMNGGHTVRSAPAVIAGRYRQASFVAR